MLKVIYLTNNFVVNISNNQTQFTYQIMDNDGLI